MRELLAVRLGKMPISQNTRTSFAFQTVGEKTADGLPGVGVVYTNTFI